MGKSTPSPPPVPNPSDLIAADAAANRITQFTPYGNLLFGSVGDQGQFVQGAVPEDGMAAAFTQETPFQSQLRMLQENIGLGLGNIASQRLGLPTNTSIAPGQGTYSDAYGNVPRIGTGFENLGNIAPDQGSDTSIAPGQGFPTAGELLGGTIGGPYAPSTGQVLPTSPGFIEGTMQSDVGINPPQETDPTNPFTGPVTTSDLPAYSFQDATNLPEFKSTLPGAGTGPTSIDVPENLPTLPTDFETTREQVTQSVFDRQLGLLQPEFTRQKEALEQNLADRGLPIGGEAYNSAIDRLERQQGEQQQRLAQQADVVGGQEAQRLFNQASSARGQLFREAAAQGEFGQQAANVAQQNAARQQLIADQLRANELNNLSRQTQLNERMGLRNLNFNELAALLGGPQIQQPTFFAPSAVNTLGANQLAQQGAMNAYNQQMANYGSGLGGLFDLAGSMGSAYILR
jgi:hypothetical protein